MIINNFPGYESVYFETDKKYHNIYRNTDVGRGGYIISNPGVYTNVALLDVVSLHPHSILAMNCFGEYTKNFTDILDARVAIKHKDYDTARTMLNGRLAPYLEDESATLHISPILNCFVVPFSTNVRVLEVGACDNVGTCRAISSSLALSSLDIIPAEVDVAIGNVICLDSSISSLLLSNVLYIILKSLEVTSGTNSIEATNLLRSAI